MTNKVFAYAVSLNFGNAPPNPLTPGALAGYRRTTSDPDVTATILAVVPMIDPGGGNAPIPIEGLTDNLDDVASVVTASRLPVIARLTGYDSALAAWDRVRVFTDNAEAQAAAVQGLLAVANRGQIFNGATFDRIRAASAAHLAAFSGQGVALAAQPGEWAIQHTPVAAAQATISRAAAAGARHVCRSITASIAALAVQGQIIINLRDGISGAGAVLWSAQFILAAGTSDRIALSGLNIVGSVNTAMTLEVAAAPALTNFASVSLTGYDAI